MGVCLLVCSSSKVEVFVRKEAKKVPGEVCSGLCRSNGPNVHRPQWGQILYDFDYRRAFDYKPLLNTNYKFGDFK